MGWVGRSRFATRAVSVVDVEPHFTDCAFGRGAKREKAKEVRGLWGSSS